MNQEGAHKAPSFFFAAIPRPEIALFEKQVEIADKKAIIFDRMITIAEKESYPYQKKVFTRTIDHHLEETNETAVSTCGWFGVNKQVYYRRKWSAQKNQESATKVLEQVMGVRKQMTRIVAVSSTTGSAIWK